MKRSMLTNGLVRVTQQVALSLLMICGMIASHAQSPANICSPNFCSNACNQPIDCEGDKNCLAAIPNTRNECLKACENNFSGQCQSSGVPALSAQPAIVTNGQANISFDSGAASEAGLNISKRSGMVNSVTKNWKPPAEQLQAQDSLAQSTTLADPFADSNSNAPALSGDSPTATTSNPSAPTPGGTSDENPIKTAWDFTCYLWNPETDILGTAADYWTPTLTGWAPKSGDSTSTVAMKVGGWVVGGTLLALPASYAVGTVAVFQDAKGSLHDLSTLGQGMSQAGVEMNAVADQPLNGQTSSNQGTASAQIGCAPPPSPSPVPVNPMPNPAPNN